MERTKGRPLAARELSVKEAICFCIAHFIAGLLVFAFFNLQGIIISLIFGFISLLYPLAKRVTYYPQVVLGVCYNSGLLIANIIISGRLNYCILPMYLSSILWTLIYDTVYALQDTKDDVKIGVKGLAVKWGSKTIENSKRLNVLMHLGFGFGALLCGLNPMFCVMLCVSLACINLQLNSVDLNDTKTCDRFFTNNKYYGLFILINIFMSRDYTTSL